MLHKLVREIARKHNLTHGKTMEMLIDFFQTLVEDERLITQELVDYFESEIVAAKEAGEFNQTEVNQIFGSKPIESIETDRLDADTKEIVKFLLEKGVRVNTPVDIKFIGDKKAVVKLMCPGAFKRQVAVVTRIHDMLIYNTVNFDNTFATVE